MSATTRPIRVMVVDDAVVVRGLIGKWLDEEPDMEIVARHRNGKEAVDGVEASNPDIVILDIEMPVMDGLEALPLLLKRKPGLCVIMASTLTMRNAEISLKALGLGATDYIPKPEGSSSVANGVDFRNDLIFKVRQLGRDAVRKAAIGKRISARINSAKTPIGKVDLANELGSDATSASKRVDGPEIRTRPYSLIAPRVLLIGSSTGGPQALTGLLTAIGSKIGHVPVLIAQHMPPNFTSILAKNLEKVSGRPAQEAVDGTALEPGHIYVAPGGFHMVVQELHGKPVVRLKDTPPVNFCKPAVDPLFESAADVFGAATLTAVLTGMGSDGANGVRRLAVKGGSILAQDEETSVVWGMPKAAAETGCCNAVVSLEEIGTKIANILSGKRP